MGLVEQIRSADPEHDAENDKIRQGFDFYAYGAQLLRAFPVDTVKEMSIDSVYACLRWQDVEARNREVLASFKQDGKFMKSYAACDVFQDSQFFGDIYAPEMELPPSASYPPHSVELFVGARVKIVQEHVEADAIFPKGTRGIVTALGPDFVDVELHRPTLRRDAPALRREVRIGFETFACRTAGGDYIVRLALNLRVAFAETWNSLQGQVGVFDDHTPPGVAVLFIRVRRN